MGPIRHTLRLLLGISLVVVGIVGLILPVMPGWIFLIPGLLILGDYFPPVKRLVDWAKGRFKEAEQQYRRHQDEKTDESANAQSDLSRKATETERVASETRNSQQ